MSARTDPETMASRVAELERQVRLLQQRLDEGDSDRKRISDAVDYESLRIDNAEKAIAALRERIRQTSDNLLGHIKRVRDKLDQVLAFLGFPPSNY